MLALFSIGNIFTDLIGDITGSGIEQLSKAFVEINEQNHAYLLMVAVMFFNALAANLGM